MSSPNSQRVMPNWINQPVTPKTSNTNKTPESCYAIKRRSFDPLTPESAAKMERNSDNQNDDSLNGFSENEDEPQPSVRIGSVSSGTDNNRMDNDNDEIVSRSDSVPLSPANNIVTSSEPDVTEADSTSDSNQVQSTSNPPREMCRYGPNCYRINASHREVFSHPGDTDYLPRVANPNFLIKPNDDAPDCRFGTSCYRKNPQHFKNNKHPEISATGLPKRNKKRINSSLDYELSSESEFGEDFSGDDDEEYVPPDSEGSFV